MALFVLAHRRHTGKTLHHGRTSYASLAFILMLCGVLLTSYSTNVSAAVQNPQEGSIGLSGAVRGPAPTRAAVIQSPSNGFRLSTSPVTVSGTCPVNTYVSLYRNGVFSGVAVCQGDGTFNLLVELVPGQNQLQAKISDTLGQAGPDSNIVGVFYAPVSTDVGGGQFGTPLLLISEVGIVGISPGQKLQRTVTIIGGTGPYAISWDFGDDTIVAIPQSVAGEGSATHSYQRPGTYRVTVTVTDSTGNTAIIQLVTVVNGVGDSVIASTRNGSDIPGILFGLWPLYIMTVLLVFAFWLGERRELWALRRRHQVMPGV
jgi:hypothetical protein